MVLCLSVSSASIILQFNIGWSQRRFVIVSKRDEISELVCEMVNVNLAVPSDQDTSSAAKTQSIFKMRVRHSCDIGKSLFSKAKTTHLPYFISLILEVIFGARAVCVSKTCR